MRSGCYIFFVLSLFLFEKSVYSQRSANWYFGYGAGVTFTTSPPTSTTNGSVFTSDCSSSISDQSGNLLFYTDGITVWNRNHQVMPNGSGLVGSNTGGQSALIIPMPCYPNKYVIFHVTEFVNPGYLNYSVVDMSLSGGFGDVVSGQKNISLGSGWTEKLCAYYNANGGFYWVLTHKWGNNQFVAFNVSSAGIATQSVVSSVGSVHNCGSVGGVHDAMGQLTISQDGLKVANALTCQDVTEVFDFNPATGTLSNSIVIPGDGNYSWGTAFSPNSQVLYVNNIFGQKLYQYNLSVYTQTAVTASQYTVFTTGTGGYNYGYMELGQDGKIYVARPNINQLAVIGSPNFTGTACNYTHSGISLGIKNSSWGLSRIAYGIPSGAGFTGSISCTPGNYICLGQTATLIASPATSYSWSTGATGNSISVSPSITTVYSVVTNGTCSTGGSAQVTVNVLPLPLLSVNGSQTLCAGLSATLTVIGASTYTWSNLSNLSQIVVSPLASTVYTVSGTGSNGCISSSSGSVNVLGVQMTVSGTNSVCAGGTATLTASGASTYTWSGGQTGSSAIYTPSATTVYSVVGSSGACTSNPITLTVNVTPLPLVTISGNSTVCLWQQASLHASGATTYTWSNGATGSSIFFTTTTPVSYTVTGSSGQPGCMSTATVYVAVSECLSLNENELNRPVAFPNPFKNVLYVKGVFQAETKLIITDLVGQEIRSIEAFVSEELELNTSDLKSGIYFLIVRHPNKSERLKILKD